MQQGREEGSKKLLSDASGLVGARVSQRCGGSEILSVINNYPKNGDRRKPSVESAQLKPGWRVPA